MSKLKLRFKKGILYILIIVILLYTILSSFTSPYQSKELRMKRRELIMLNITFNIISFSLLFYNTLNNFLCLGNPKT